MSEALSFYLHIPYCARRCGYCDFNTYTPSELSISQDLIKTSATHIDLMVKEIELAREVSTATLVPTIFIGGGTPTLMQPKDLARVIDAIGSRFEISKEIEITIEANPDTVDAKKLEELRKAGINRISFGVQSFKPHVLAALDRTHNPDNVSLAVHGARAVGFEEVSVDLIYGTPGETLKDWSESIDLALALPITHISAYALIVESGTKLGAQVKRGEVIMPDEDETADKYLLADDKFRQAGFEWYELSNWAKVGSYSRHNMAYWVGANWWGVGPGAHSHIDSRRFWNVKHPNTYKEKLLTSGDPMQDQEFLSPKDIENEKVMLQIRLREGLSREYIQSAQEGVLQGYLAAGYLDSSAWQAGRISLTPTGRLIADRIVREIAL